MKMEDSLQAFAVRAACFIGELEVPFSEEFDGHDYGATHVIAYLGDEPIGAVRVRWFKSFAMTERLAVLQRFRGHHVGQQLLEHCRTLAQSRGCNMLYAQVLPFDTGYWEKQGWRRLVPEAQSKAGPNQIVAMIKAVDPGAPLARGRGARGDRLAARATARLRSGCRSARARINFVGRAIYQRRRFRSSVFSLEPGRVARRGGFPRMNGGVDGSVRDRRRTERSTAP